MLKLFRNAPDEPKKISPLFLEEGGRRYKLGNGTVTEYTGTGLKHEFNFRSGVMHTYEAESYTYRFADLEHYVLKTSIGLKQIPDETLTQIRNIGLRIIGQILEAETPDNTRWIKPEEAQIAEAKAFFRTLAPQ